MANRMKKAKNKEPLVGFKDVIKDFSAYSVFLLLALTLTSYEFILKNSDLSSTSSLSFLNFLIIYFSLFILFVVLLLNHNWKTQLVLPSSFLLLIILSYETFSFVLWFSLAYAVALIVAYTGMFLIRAKFVSKGEYVEVKYPKKIPSNFSVNKNNKNNLVDKKSNIHLKKKSSKKSTKKSNKSSNIKK